ncbi:HipA family kinase [Psychrobacillus sp. FSL K6-2684]|uniref:HipA family kinase n=1 Tax=Psychrobacillus sp. FSL K6-2684 TaxID=2921547 RepID=UPI0030F8E80C
MVHQINVETVLKYLGQGVSRPAVIMGDDFRQYVLKTQKVHEGGSLQFYNCMFLNELLAYQIACYLEVPIPEAAIAYLDNRLIDRDPALMFVHRFYEGNLFASLELTNTEENLVENYEEMRKMDKPYLTRTWNAFFSNIVNVNDIAKIVAFDLLIANFDRYGNTGNLLVSTDEDGRKVFSIDHGHAFFGPKWETGKINALNAPSQTFEYIDAYVDVALKNNVKPGQGFADGLGSVFRAIEPSIDLTNLQSHSFIEVIYAIESITEDLIDEWISQIPKEWFDQTEMMNQISYYKSFLLKQKNLVRAIVQRMAERKAFTNYLGGALQWKKEKNVGTV